jgi:ribosomal protein S18 acetylase RimI-like enzyme
LSAAGERDLPVIRKLLVEYAGSLGFPLDFQDFDRELADLPGAYAPPHGALLIARVDGDAAGCVALRPLERLRRLEPGICELKRLFVRPEHRGLGLGRLLATAMLEEARRRGYRRIRLDTTHGMEAAQALYMQLGFRDIAPYRTNPVAGTRFLELDLALDSDERDV